MASVRIEDEARRDPRFKILGKKIGSDRFSAIGRMIEVWAHCTERETYFLQPEIIDACADFDGFCELLLLPDVNLAEKTDQGIRIKGTQGRIEWLAAKRENGKSGGRPKKNLSETETKPKVNLEVTYIEPTPNPLTLTPALVPVPVLAPVKIKEKEEVKLISSELEACIKDWSGTLQYFKIDRPILPHEKMKIAALVKMYGDVKSVRYALVGMRFEQKSESFDPGKHLSLERLYDSKLFEKFINLAAAEMSKQKQKQVRPAQPEKTEPPPAGFSFGGFLKSVPTGG